MAISWHVYVCILLTSEKHLYNYFSSYSHLLLLVCIVEWSWSAQIGFLVLEQSREMCSKNTLPDFQPLTGLEEVWKKSPKQWMVLM